jgi:ABC-type nitrate/sulfonate/bicarbonate transport system permease component
MFVGLVITGIMGWALTLVVDAMERIVVPWRSDD